MYWSSTETKIPHVRGYISGYIRTLRAYEWFESDIFYCNLWKVQLDVIILYQKHGESIDHPRASDSNQRRYTNIIVHQQIVVLDSHLKAQYNSVQDWEVNTKVSKTNRPIS